MQVAELAQELGSLGRAQFEARYGRLFLVITDPRVLDEASSWVNTETRQLDELISASEREPLDVRPLHPHTARGPVTVGRDGGCDVPIQHRHVSKVHAHFHEDGGLLFLTDRGSKNGTRVNQQTLAANTPTAIDVGDALRFGDVTATVWSLEDLLAAIG